MIKDVIAKLVARETLTREEAAGAMTDIMSGDATEAQIGAFITGLRLTGETPEVIAGCAEVMRANATPVKCDDPNAVDIVGTGGDGAHTFNISTTAAFVIAGTGVPPVMPVKSNVSSSQLLEPVWLPTCSISNPSSLNVIGTTREAHTFMVKVSELLKSASAPRARVLPPQV